MNLPITMDDAPTADSPDLPGLSRPWRTNAQFKAFICAEFGTGLWDTALQSPWSEAMTEIAMAWALWSRASVGLAIEIADEAARSDVECYALYAPSNYPAPVYDTTRVAEELPRDPELEQSYRESVAKAVRYLDLRRLLVRPFAGQPWFVSFGGA